MALSMVPLAKQFMYEHDLSCNVRVTLVMQCVVLTAVVGGSWICRRASRRSDRIVCANVEERAQETDRYKGRIY